MKRKAVKSAKPQSGDRSSLAHDASLAKHGKVIIAALVKLGMQREFDLVLHLPSRYDDETRLYRIGEAPHGATVLVEGVVTDNAIKYRPKRQLVCTLEDASGVLVIRFLNFYMSQARQLAPNFNEFGERFLTRNAIDPFDSVLRQAHEKLGRIQPDTHLVFSPPVLLTGEERLEDVMRMPARQAMILNGDLWTQLANPPRDATVAGLAVVKDEQGRDRMKVAWT